MTCVSQSSAARCPLSFSFASIGYACCSGPLFASLYAHHYSLLRAISPCLRRIPTIALTPVSCWQIIKTTVMMARFRLAGISHSSRIKLLKLASPIRRRSCASWPAISWISRATYSDSAGNLMQSVNSQHRFCQKRFVQKYEEHTP